MYCDIVFVEILMCSGCARFKNKGSRPSDCATGYWIYKNKVVIILVPSVIAEGGFLCNC